jgi:hypothetical protein
MAGGSAAARARELREKAARLEAEAQQWDKGAEGERRTAAVLAGLASRGYVVLDDLSIPGSKANIDHVVVGPSGVTVIETKAYTGQLRINDGTIWHGRYPLRKELAAAAFEADKVREVVAATGWSVTIRSLVCIHGAEVPVDRTGALDGVELCGPLDLLARIEAAPALLAPEHVAHLVRVIEEALPPQRIPAPPPAPAASRPAAGGAGAQRDRAPAVAPVVSLQRRRRRALRPTPRVGIAGAADSALRALTRLALQLVVVVVGALIALAAASAALQAVSSSVTTTTTSTTTLLPPEAPVVPPPVP